MEEELKCPICKHFFYNPVLLPCYHALCLNCAVSSQQETGKSSYPSEVSSSSIDGEQVEKSSNSGSSGCGSECPDSDNVSLYSEADSGVVCTSRPNSYVGTPSIQGIVFPPFQQAAFSLTCPVCQKIVYFDDNGANNLPKYRLMQNVVDRYQETKNLSMKCQLCEANPKDAVIMCEQCEVFYCEKCRESCHPSRGPLAKHSLIPALQGKANVRIRNKGAGVKCSEHSEDTLSMYCMLCRIPVCTACLQDGRHARHDVQALNAICKAQKTELSSSLQSLSERAKAATEFIHALKKNAEFLNDGCAAFENQLGREMERLMNALKRREEELRAWVRAERDRRVASLKEQVSLATAKLQKTTGLIQFSIDALKEGDPTAFLQVGNMMVHRVGGMEMTWSGTLIGEVPRVPTDLDLTLDDAPLLKAIHQLHFVQMKPPGAPSLIPEECSAENNTVTLAWAPHPTARVDGYILELDDNNQGSFKEVYCGQETVCTVDGLHFNTVYTARVKAFNTSGEGPYSEPICLQTADVAWFTLDGSSAPPEVRVSSDGLGVTCDCYEHRMVLGCIGFSRGVHYWEWTVDKYDGNPDIAFGVARFDSARDRMLGKEDKSWGMYIDSTRSWFLHGDSHSQRTDGGIDRGATVGVLLDLNRKTLSFFVNEEPQGGVAFRDLQGVFYPAVSLNCNSSLTLHTALDPPTDHESEGEG
ncbi:unnamed protein product [Darwinula stevensoni]|uniref:E3 ubiquitin-protein ligase TRIM9 n=1 Tax=Darwinula stevensoni TaxID=69355 RepID=A0A7R8XDT5_9CRUS|nr:unnamed protein product [Darwinula stevensoni]CAG0888934.1 unnamed protein product [Darwinula stevensoni]